VASIVQETNTFSPRSSTLASFELFGIQVGVVVQRTFEGQQYEAIWGLRRATRRVALLRSASVQIELFEFVNPVFDLLEVAQAEQPNEQQVDQKGLSINNVSG
jgi:hypothetical protein